MVPRSADLLSDAQVRTTLRTYYGRSRFGIGFLMKVSMAEINKQANSIVRRVIETGQTATVLKHGRPVAEIRPLSDAPRRERALDILCAFEPVPVTIEPEAVLAGVRTRGL